MLRSSESFSNPGKKLKRANSFLAFTASSESCEEASEEEVDDEDGLLVAYNNLFKECQME